MDEFKLKRKTNSENICQFCGKSYTLKKCLQNHETIHKENKLNNKKVKVKKEKNNVASALIQVTEILLYSSKF